MAVQFDKLRDTIKKLGEVAAERQKQFDDQLADLLNLLAAIGDNRALITESIQHGKDNGRIEKRDYRGAVPLFPGDAVDEGINAPDVADRPQQATIIAVDGSQAVPSRHDVYQYYLLNAGWIVYHLGRDVAPDSDSEPYLYYPGDTQNSQDSDFQYVHVSIERDMLEIKTLARQTFEQRTAVAPILSIMDQRLQYWPIGLNDGAQSTRYMRRWLDEMETIKRAGGLLIGYIERPETGAVVTMAHTVEAKDYGGDKNLNDRPNVSDAALFRRILQPGQRSCVYEVVNDAAQYEPFREANQEICFFYFHPPGNGDVTRIDIPKWAAEPEVIEQIHGILYDQCAKLGGYPYVLTRADEQAVVSHDDKAFLESMIMREMLKLGVKPRTTAKQRGKELTRSGRRRR